MLRRQRTGSVICTSCGVLVGVDDDRCYNCNRRNPGLWGWAPVLRSLGHDLGFVPFVIGACVVMLALSLLVTVGMGLPISTQGVFSFGSPAWPAMFLFGASGAEPVFRFGRWWTVLSASWLHFGLLHIFMNMMAMRQLAPATADLYGPGRMVIIYVLAGVTGFTLSTLAFAFVGSLPILGGGPATAGASASIAGLIGAILAYGHRSGSSMARQYAVQYIIMLLIMGFVLGGIDNYAHAGGFGGGYLVARYLDPLKAERIDHLAIAVGLLAVSLVAIVVSVVHGVQFLPR